jgi:hypothetical protein
MDRDSLDGRAERDNTTRDPEGQEELLRPLQRRTASVQCMMRDHYHYHLKFDRSIASNFCVELRGHRDKHCLERKTTGAVKANVVGQNV